jgi:hypothetical protein
MKRPPRRREVTTAIRAVESEVTAALKEQNERAAKEVARGRYDEAESAVATAKVLDEFRSRTRALRAEWQSIGSSGGTGYTGVGANGERSKLWEYFEPIQECLRSLGGEAKRQDLENAIEPFLADRLKPSDRDVMSNGFPRWKVTVRRARKAMIAEGLLEDTPGAWRLRTS